MKTWFWLAALPDGRLRWPGWLKAILIAIFLACTAAGTIYAFVVFRAVQERSVTPHVHTHSTR